VEVHWDLFIDCLLFTDLYQPFIDANRLDDSERRMLKLKRLIHKLNEYHFETFKHLAKHLNKVALYGDINRVCNHSLLFYFMKAKQSRLSSKTKL